MYGQGTQAASRRRSVRYYGDVRSRQAGRSREQVRLIQLAVCLALFLAIFLGRGVFPHRLAQLHSDIFTLISTDFDFRGALSGLGESLAESDTILSDLGDFCVEVFGSGSQEEKDQAKEPAVVPPQPTGVLTSELRFLSHGSSPAALTAHYVDFARYGLEPPEIPQEPVPEEEPPAEAVEVPEEPPAVPAAGTVVLVSDYDGKELPDNYTMDQLSLGELETMTPVMGHLTSDYGYRDHPINGKNLFHGGLDISGQAGDPIAAFAAGTVEYTGENDSYGLYLQVDHGNGVKSFYAHCSKIVVTKGQTVAIGEKLAEVGSTGISTAPHLHLEIKYEKMHLNPAYYVELLEQ